MVPAVPDAENLEEKKILNRILSIQYSVFSALQLRAPYLNDIKRMPELAPYFFAELSGLRKEVIPYLKDCMAILAHHNCLWNPDMLKVWHFYWREAHDEFYTTAGINATK